MLEIIAAIERELGRKMPHNVGPRRAGDPPALVASAEKARATLGWRATYSLEQIIATAAAWQRKLHGD